MENEKELIEAIKHLESIAPVQEIEIGLYRPYHIKSKFGAPEIDPERVKRVLIVY